jgi:hypothetical protein
LGVLAAPLWSLTMGRRRPHKFVARVRGLLTNLSLGCAAVVCRRRSHGGLRRAPTVRGERQQIYSYGCGQGETNLSSQRGADTGRCFACALQQRGKTRVLTGAVGTDCEASTSPPPHLSRVPARGRRVPPPGLSCRRRSRGGLREYGGRTPDRVPPQLLCSPLTPVSTYLPPRRPYGVPIGSCPLHLDERDGTPVSAAWWRWWEGFLLTRPWWQD